MPAVSAEPSSSGRPGPNLIFIGPPGAGKGSLAARLCSLNVEHVSSGDFFRAEVARGTPLGSAFASALKKGEFVSDELTLAVMKKWFFARKTSSGFLLDGFPRNLLQAQVFSEWLEARRETLAACFYLDLQREDAILRISQRRVCPKDGMVYHLTFHPPQLKDRCDGCGGPLVQRTDDTEETVAHRWALFEKNTLPLVGYYRNQGLLRVVDASKAIDDVHAGVLSLLTRLNLL